MTTRYIYDASGNLLAEADENNTIVRYYIYGKGLVAMVTASGELYCYHFDANANTIALTDSGQQIVNAYAYTPFGLIGNEQEAIEQPFKFVGQFGVMTEPNGLYYMRARYYDPQVGRFISEDPIGFEGGDVNLYVYASNNSIMFVDPWGLCAQNFSLGERIGQQVQWQVQVSGLTNLPGIAKETTQILGAAGVGLAAYAAYPVVVTTILTHPQETLDFVTSLSPGTTPAMSSVYGPLAAAVGDLLGVK